MHFLKLFGRLDELNFFEDNYSEFCKIIRDFQNYFLKFLTELTLLIFFKNLNGMFLRTQMAFFLFFNTSKGLKILKIFKFYISF